MTKNQIDYWNLQEVKRNNARNWKENQLHNRNVEAETHRANTAREYQERMNLVETNRANLEREAQNRRSLDEQRRHSLATETENQRSNLATEANNRFANNTNLVLGLGQLANARTGLSIQQHQADTARMNAYTQSRNIDETRRSHMANEEIAKSNLLEQVRANKRQEELSADRNALTKAQQRIDFGNLKVTRERNIQQMQYNYDALKEQMKFNEANLILNAGKTAVGSAIDLLKVGAIKGGKR